LLHPSREGLAAVLGLLVRIRVIDGVVARLQLVVDMLLVHIALARLEVLPRSVHDTLAAWLLVRAGLRIDSLVSSYESRIVNLVIELGVFSRVSRHLALGHIAPLDAVLLLLLLLLLLREVALREILELTSASIFKVHRLLLLWFWLEVAKLMLGQNLRFLEGGLLRLFRVLAIVD